MKHISVFIKRVLDDKVPKCIACGQAPEYKGAAGWYCEKCKPSSDMQHYRGFVDLFSKLEQES